MVGLYHLKIIMNIKKLQNEVYFVHYGPIFTGGN